MQKHFNPHPTDQLMLVSQKSPDPWQKHYLGLTFSGVGW